MEQNNFLCFRNMLCIESIRKVFDNFPLMFYSIALRTPERTQTRRCRILGILINLATHKFVSFSSKASSLSRHIKIAFFIYVSCSREKIISQKKTTPKLRHQPRHELFAFTFASFLLSCFVLQRILVCFSLNYSHSSPFGSMQVRSQFLTPTTMTMTAHKKARANDKGR